eukprot:TRINITY_DN5463_c0_g1_i10.p1 TRINITY_DN5463_c0_g1~~TRINITY_DN5463_c0_g1_i10.p1  ORF type:complete len:210 (-),score=64.15 TRINITY_DN5463_c0_g1_i10:1130-1759(-)
MNSSSSGEVEENPKKTVVTQKKEKLQKETRKRKASVESTQPVKKLKEKESSLAADVDLTQPTVARGEIKILSWNIVSWKVILQKGFASYIREENPDIICLNETKVDFVPEDSFPGYHSYFFSCRRNSGYSGTAILSKKEPISVQKGIGIEEYDTEGRCITAEFENFFLVACYVPCSGKPDNSTKLPDRPPPPPPPQKWVISAFHADLPT